MSNQTRYNRILFLTTLSVYMGLVLMGGASPALAQAAMAKSFELKTELEAKDDLDKKPDDKKEEEVKQLSSSLEDYFREVENFVEDLKNLRGTDKFDKDFYTFSISNKSAAPCNVDGDPARKSTENINDLWLRAAIVDAAYEFEGFDSLSDRVLGNEFGDHKVLRNGLDLSNDKSVLKVKFSAVKELSKKAKLLSDELTQAFKLATPDKEEVTRSVLYENTRTSSDNDQIFIITNLPRAGLDELLAVK
jgi:hypothetical protein